MNSMKSRKGIFKSIRTKLIVYFCSMFMVCMIAVVLIDVYGIPFTAYDGKWNQARSGSFKSLSLVADLKKEHILRWIQERRNDAEVWSNNALLRNRTALFLDEFHGHRVKDLEGERLKDLVIREGNFGILESTLQDIKSTYKVYDRIDIICSESAATLVSTDRADLGRDHSGCSHYVEFVKPPFNNISDIEINSTSNYPHFHISQSIESADGEMIAILLMVVNAEDMIRPMLHTGEGLGQSGEALLVNKDRKILTTLRYALPDGKQAVPLEYQIAAKLAFFAARGEEGIIESTDYRGEPVLAAYRHIRLSPDLGWGLVVKSDREELFAPIKKDLLYTLLIIMLSSVIVIIVTVMIAKNISHPLHLLSHTARQVEAGNLDVRAQVLTNDETGIMARTFNSMIQRIQNWYVELEEQVQARTAQLNSLNADLIREITERKLAEKELKIHRDNLEELVEERTSNLMAMNEQLQEEIAERLRIEEALAAEKERLDVTLISIADGVITTDLEGNVIMINKAAEVLTGWTQENVFGKGLNEVFHLTERGTGEKPEDLLKEVFKTGKLFEDAGGAMLASKDDVNKILVEYSVSPIRDDDNFIIGSVLAFRDITEKRKMEEELLKSHKLDSVSLLAGGIAHDFNNILTAMLSSTTLAKAYLRQGKIVGVMEVLTEAEKASMRAKNLTRQLLTFSKGGTPVKERVPMAEFLMESVKFILSGSNVKCEFSIPDDLWEIEIDEGQINQVINNLIINAMQAMPEGGTMGIGAENVLVDKDCSVPLNEGAYLKLFVRDHGIGISGKHLSKIFDPYFTTKQKGSGLGLATTYSIIKKHDGHIEVESKIGTGTTVIIYLPASKEMSRVEREVSERTLIGGGRLILMDDDDSILKSVGALLRHLGYEVEVARDGKEMIELYINAKATTQPFDAVIVDLTIPGGMGGKEAMQRLIEIDPKVKAIVSSGYSSDSIIADYEKFGFRGVVSKPFSIGKLNDTLQKVINGN